MRNRRDRRFRVFSSVAVAALVVFGVPRISRAYDALLAWAPVAGASGYRIAIAFDADPFGVPSDVGLPALEADGLLRAVVKGLPMGPTARFRVLAYDDSVESPPSNEMALSYAEVAAVVDSDGDGLRDAEEDQDLDGVVDAGETDPNNPDTDGDGVDDGAEVTAGTDPLTPDTGSDARCGDGVIDAGEECDDGNTSNADACLNDCQAARCGDGVVYKGVEECDDGAANSDIADGACRTDCTLPSCTTADAATVCDDGNPCTNDVCNGGVCKHTFNTTPCDDGIACTTGDVCAAGVCVGRDGCGEDASCNYRTSRCEAKATPQSGLWMPAALFPSAEFGASMRTSTDFTGGADDDPEADSLTSLLVYAGGGGSESDGTLYAIDLPHDGEWYLWGRFYYPGAIDSNDANSFWVSVDDGPARKFGNNRDYFRRWHWDGDGEIEFEQLAPLSLGSLGAGRHWLRITRREIQPEPPRLDVLFVTGDPTVVPNDDSAREALGACPFGRCDHAAVCGDVTRSGALTLTDAWHILRAAVKLDNMCRLSLCDVNGNGGIDTLDAMIVMRASVGVRVEKDFRCRPTIGFGLTNASQVEQVSFLLDYRYADISFVDAQNEVTCVARAGNGESRVIAQDDAAAGVLQVAIALDEPVSGTVLLAECYAYPSAGDELPGPGAFALSVGEIIGQASGKTSPTIGVLPQ